jgi:predicted adenylyl cyclase CyaB
MPANVEIKAVLANRAGAELTAARLSGCGPEILHQEDIFFPGPRGRLKLRILAPDQGELIQYDRADAAEARLSRYIIARTPDPRALLEILAGVLGTGGVVKKTRHLYLLGQTRVHIDAVDGLGDFLELEVVLQPGQSEADGRRIAEALLAEFGIEKHELIGVAYIDLLEQRSRQAGVLP